MFERYREIQERRKSGESSECGFTLIELLIVIIVLGILAAIVIFSLTGVTGQSKPAACTTDAKTVEIAADAYQAENRHLPGDVTDLTARRVGARTVPALAARRRHATATRSASAPTTVRLTSRPAAAAAVDFDTTPARRLLEHLVVTQYTHA